MCLLNDHEIRINLDMNKIFEFLCHCILCINLIKIDIFYE